MTNLLVLYSGESMESLKLICGTSDPAINMLFAEMMKDALDEDIALSEHKMIEQTHASIKPPIPELDS